MRPQVALVAHGVHERGGMERACAELLRHGHRDYDFTVVSTELASDLVPLAQRWIRVRVPMRPIPLKFAAFWLVAGRLVRAIKVDLVHTVGAIVPNRVDIAAVHLCHAGFVGAVGRLAPPSRPLLRRCNSAAAQLLALAAERWCYRSGRLRLFAAVSPGVREELAAYYPSIDARVTPNGVDLTRFSPDTKTRTIVRATSGAKDEIIVLFVGSDWDWKGLAIAIRALALARSDRIDMRLWVVGDGARRRFSRLAADLGVSAAVTFFGPRTDTSSFYAAADIFVLPSLYETFSLVGFEAAACGLPIISTAVHGIGDLVKSGGGILVERDAHSCADALTRLAVDSELRARIGQRAHQLVQSYSWRASATAVTDLYDALLA